MADESVPQLRETNRLLGGLHRTVAEVLEYLRGQYEFVERGFRLVHDSIRAQTETLGEMAIVTRLAEMHSLQHMVNGELDHVAAEEAADAEAVKRLAEHFEGARKRIAAVRKRRAREVLSPAHGFVEHDLEEHLESRSHELDGVLQDYLRVTRSGLNAREQALHDAIVRARAEVDEFVAQRQRVAANVDGLRLDRGRLGIVPTVDTLAVPFYAVEVAEPDGTISVQVLPPARVRALEGSPCGYDLEPLPGFAELAARLTDNAPRVQQLVATYTQEDTPTLATLLSAAEPRRLWARAAWLSMLWTLRKRVVRLRSEPSPVSHEAARMHSVASPRHGTNTPFEEEFSTDTPSAQQDTDSAPRRRTTGDL